MSQTIRTDAGSFSARLRARLKRHAPGIVAALLIEVLLVLMLLTLAPDVARRIDVAMSVFNFSPDEGKAPEPTPEKQEEAAKPKPQQRQRVQPPATQPPQPTPPAAQTPPLPPPIVPMTREQMAAADLRTMPTRPGPPAPGPRPMMGPPAVGIASGDTQRVTGQGPQGQPLYAAAWYREPYDDELRGYLSTARGPGWGLIACRTVPDYRVEDCVALDEYPDGSGIARAVVAAAWQFRVRPPRLGGQVKVGEWVRIRIDYGVKLK